MTLSSSLWQHQTPTDNRWVTITVIMIWWPFKIVIKYLISRACLTYSKKHAMSQSKWRSFSAKGPLSHRCRDQGSVGQQERVYATLWIMTTSLKRRASMTLRSKRHWLSSTIVMICLRLMCRPRPFLRNDIHRYRERAMPGRACGPVVFNRIRLLLMQVDR